MSEELLTPNLDNVLSYPSTCGYGAFIEAAVELQQIKIELQHQRASAAELAALRARVAGLQAEVDACGDIIGQPHGATHGHAEILEETIKEHQADNVRLAARVAELEQWPEKIAEALYTKVGGDRSLETWAAHVRREHEHGTHTGNRLIAVARERDAALARVAELESWKSVLLSEYTTRDLQYEAVRDDLRKASARVADLERALESRDLICETLQRELGPERTMRAFGFDPERVLRSRREIANGNIVPLSELAAAIRARGENDAHPPASGIPPSRCACGRMTNEKPGDGCTEKFAHCVPWYPAAEKEGR